MRKRRSEKIQNLVVSIEVNLLLLENGGFEVKRGRRSNSGCSGHHASAERSHSDGFETELGKRDFGNRDEAASSRDGLRWWESCSGSGAEWSSGGHFIGEKKYEAALQQSGKKNQYSETVCFICRDSCNSANVRRVGTMQRKACSVAVVCCCFLSASWIFLFVSVVGMQRYY